jgi:CO dehydrogenase/acetyl-CoA synthase beta subunit
MMNRTKIIIIIISLVGLAAVVYGGDFTMLKEGKTVTVGTFTNAKEFVELLKTQLASKDQVEKEMKEIHGLMFFIMPEPHPSIENTHEGKIMDFYKYPEKYGYHADEYTRLYSTKEEAVNSEEMKRRAKQVEAVKLFIIGVDIKESKMHSISKSNGIRIYLDPWYKE